MHLGRMLYEAHHRPGSPAYRYTQMAVWLLIVASIASLGFELAYESLNAATLITLRGFDAFILVFFSIELLLKVLMYHPPELDLLQGSWAWKVRAHITGRLWYVLSPSVVLDVVTVLAFMPVLRGLRALRLVRLIAVVRFPPYTNPILGVLRAFVESWLLYLSTLGIFATIVVIGGLSLYLIESEENQQIETMADGMWWALVTITTVGFGDITPATSSGRWLASGVMIVGMFTVALFAGIVTTTLLGVVVRLQAEQFRMSGRAHHIVVCGYESGARQLLDTLLEERGGSRELLLFGAGGRPVDIPADFTWVEGDPTREQHLSKVRPEYADAIVVVGQRSKPPQEADATTLLTIFTIRRYIASRSRIRQKPLYIIAEVLDNENLDHARAAGADEVIETTRLGFAMMAHSVIAPGSGEVMSRVASASAASIYVGFAPIEVGVEYSQLATRMHLERGISVIGISDPESGHVILAPNGELEVHPGQALIYLSTEAQLEPA